jgi:hypothetical protein
MKRKNLDLKKKLVLNKETIANLTPAQQAKLAGGWHPATAAITCLPESGNYSDCNCVDVSNAPNTCKVIATANCGGGGNQSGYCIQPTYDNNCLAN